MVKRPYLIENRLCDVLALIQVLSLDKHGHRSENGLQLELQGKPISGDSWTVLARDHPEFFRVDSTKEHKLSLVARHVTEINEKGIREISPDLIKTLIEIAVDLHDRQNEKSGWWKVWLPLLVAIVTVISSYYVQYKSNENQSFLKHYEVDLKPKQEGYANFMKSVSQSFFYAQNDSGEQMNQSLDNMETSFYVIEPFLSRDTRDKIWSQYQQFSAFCYSLSDPRSDKKSIKTMDVFISFKKKFRMNLYDALFLK